MSRPLSLYGGAVKANEVSRFVRAGKVFVVIRPGYDAQGEKRATWTQIVHEDVPIYEVKVRTALDNVLDKFDILWDRHIGDEDEQNAFLNRALESVKRERRAKFRDGRSGVAPAPALSRDGREPPLTYPS